MLDAPGGLDPVRGSAPDPVARAPRARHVPPPPKLNSAWGVCMMGKH